MQPPFFDPTADDAVNYGGIGAVIGHEITHGFDDQGSRSDADGNLRNWWTADDRTRFTAKTDKLVQAIRRLRRGRRSARERPADAGRKHRRPGRRDDRLRRLPKIARRQTGPGHRRLHRRAAVLHRLRHSWRGSIRDAELQLMLRTNPHSPDRFRTLVPLSNVQAFYDAFDIKPGDKMYRPPEERVEVW